MTIPGSIFRQIQDALVSAFPNAGALGRFLRFQMDQPLSSVTSDGPIPDMVFDIITWAESTGQLTDLVAEAKAVVPGNALLGALDPTSWAGAPVASTSSNNNAFLSSFILNRQAFIDRMEGRNTIRQFLFTDNGPCALVIAGSPRSGRSYTRYLIAHLAKDVGFKPVVVRFTSKLNPAQFTRKVLRGLEVPYDESELVHGHESIATFVESLGDLIVERSRQAGKACIIVDGIAQAGIDKKTESLLHYLVRATEIGPANERLRLALIEYKGTFANVDPSAVLTDTTVEPDAVGEAELTVWFERLCAERERGAPNADVLAAAVTDIIEAAPMGTADRMQKLRDAVEAAMPQFV